MRTSSMLALVAAVTCSARQSQSENYSGLLKEDGHTWCVYKDSAEFKSAAATIKPTESARVSYRSGELTELTYQLSAESGDWIVIDKYSFSNGDLLLRRASLIVEPSRKVIQEATVHDLRASAFRLVRVTTLDGKEADLSNVDLPVVPVKTELSTLPFVQAVAEMRRRAIGKFCQK